MNNTKWRELLTIIAQLSIKFDVAYVEAKQFQFGAITSLDILEEKGIADPGIAGGPTNYRDIFAIRIRRYKNKRNPVTGAVFPDESLSKEFLVSSQSLGQIPIEHSPEYIYVYGYAQ